MDGLSVSVHGSIIIHILNLADLHEKKNALYDMSFIEVNQNPNFYNYMENS